MLKIAITREAHEALERWNHPTPMRPPQDNGDGTVTVEVDEEILAALNEHAQQVGTFSDVILRLCQGPLQ